RSMRGVTDINIMEQWINVLLSIKDFATSRGVHPNGILEMYERLGPDGIADVIFGDTIRFINESLVGSKETKAQLIERNLWYAAKIASANKYESEDWGFPKTKKIYREKYTDLLNNHSQELYRAPYKSLTYAQRIVVDEILARLLNSERN